MPKPPGFPEWLAEDDSVNESLLIHDIARMMRTEFDRRATTLGLTRAQWLALAMLYRNPGIKQSALAELLEIEPVTAGRLVDRLETAGWLERKSDPNDRRVNQLFITPRIESLVAQMRMLGLSLRSEALAGIQTKDHAALIEQLKKMKANLTAITTKTRK